MSDNFLYLASRSPRRAELLQQLGLVFEVISADVDEAILPGEAAETYVKRVAREKAEAARKKLPGNLQQPLLAADTSVVVDGEILGKPLDRSDAVAMMAKLAGRSHQVLSAIALWTPNGLHEALNVSDVRFRQISPAEAEAYWDTGEPADKAGGYAIQGRGAVFVEHLAGSYSGVMGLPLFETAELLRRAGIQILGKEIE